MSELMNDPQLEAIAKALAIEKELRPAKRQRAGITYLGQFISHDIVPATNQNRQSRHVTPYLDLGSIYGDNDKYLSPQGLFPIRPVRDIHGKIVGYDVPRIRDSNGGYPAIIAESRNDDVLVVTQLHAFFQRLHNAILCSGYAVNTDEAKEFTIKIFQILVVEEFCKNILEKTVFESYFEQGKSSYNYWDKSKIPSFFSNAAFRFGHSMVRVDYSLNKNSLGVSLSKLFTTNQKLEASNSIEWWRFFNETIKTNTQIKKGQLARRIDTDFTPMMRSVRPIDGSFGPINLILKNLASGESSKLPTGLAVAEKVYKKSSDDLVADKQFWLSKKYPNSKFAKLIQKNNGSSNISDLPLWPYILIESELAEDRRHYRYKNLGHNECLGKVGSTLVAEVLLNAIARSEFSIFVDGKYNLNAALKGMGAFGSVIRPKYSGQFNFMHLFNKVNSIEGNPNVI